MGRHFVAVHLSFCDKGEKGPRSERNQALFHQSVDPPCGLFLFLFPIENKGHCGGVAAGFHTASTVAPPQFFHDSGLSTEVPHLSTSDSQEESGKVDETPRSAPGALIIAVAVTGHRHTSDTGRTRWRHR